MTEREKQYKSLAVLLMSALVDTHNAAIKFEVLAQEELVHKGTKKQILKCLTELNQIRNRFDRFWGEQGKQVMDDQILSEDDTLQLQNISSLAMAAPKGIRNQIEQYAESLVQIYSANKK